MRSEQRSGSALVWLPLDLSLAPKALDIDEKDIFSNPFHQLQLFNQKFLCCTYLLLSYMKQDSLLFLR
jgi:hypothetical protein